MDNAGDVVRVIPIGEQVQHHERLMPVARFPLHVRLLIFAEASDRLSDDNIGMAYSRAAAAPRSTTSGQRGRFACSCAPPRLCPAGEQRDLTPMGWASGE